MGYLQSVGLALFLAIPSALANPLGPAEFYWLLDRASAAGDELSVMMLLEAGADPSGPNGYKAFLEKYNRPFEPSWPVCQAAHAGHIGVVRLLLQAGADPNLAEGEGVTALTVAAEHGHLEVVRLLLAAGADPTYRTLHGTAEELATRNGHDDVAAAIRNREP